MQGDLLDWPGNPGPVVHKNGPDTELAAYESIKPKLSGLRLKALQTLSGSAGMTGDEVSKKMGEWIYSVKPRLTELSRMYLVEDTGERRKNDRNRQEIVWRITDYGQKWLEENSNGN